MTAIAPTPQGTTGPFTAPAQMIAAPMPAGRRRASAPESEVPAWAQLGAALAAAGLAIFATLLAAWPWAALPVAVLAAAIFAGAFLPDLIGAHFDRRRAADDDSTSEATA